MAFDTRPAVVACRARNPGWFDPHGRYIGPVGEPTYAEVNGELYGLDAWAGVMRERYGPPTGGGWPLDQMFPPARQPYAAKAQVPVARQAWGEPT